MNSIARGTEAELFFLAYCTRNGLSVSLPINHSGEYDLIVDTPLGLRKIQVKRVYTANNHGYPIKCVDTRRILVKHSGKKGSYARQYSKDGYDFLVACDVETLRFWIIPREVTFQYKAQVYLSKKLDKYLNNWLSLGINLG